VVNEIPLTFKEVQGQFEKAMKEHKSMNPKGMWLLLHASRINHMDNERMEEKVDDIGKWLKIGFITLGSLVAIISIITA